MDRWTRSIGAPSLRRLSKVGVVGAVAVALASLAPRAAVGQAPGEAVQQAPFHLGADISFLDSPAMRPGMPERTYMENGRPSDELTILEHHGWNAYRLRVFVSPVRQAPDNSLERTIPLARRIKASGALFLLDIHYSDTWADPQHQEIPLAWRGVSFDSLEQLVESYSRDVIRGLKDAGAMPDWVQVGNEITRGTLWPLGQVEEPGDTSYLPPQPYDSTLQWEHLTRILKAGVRGVMEGAGKTPPKIAIHIDRGGDWAKTKWFFDHLEAARVPYDIIAESFYPEWGHGTLEQLVTNMDSCAARFHKDFLVAETGYGNSHVKNNPDMMWPLTAAGRIQFMADLINTMRQAPRGIGAMYWAPEFGAWNPDGSPGPVVFVLDSLRALRARPASHVPTP